MELTVKKGSIFDSHAHYDDKRFENSDAIIAEMESDWGVGGIINCAVDIDSALKCLEFSKKFSFCHTAAGFHATELPEGDIGQNLEALNQLIKENKVIAVGEIGLDYYWDDSFKEKQLEYFVEQVKLANALNLPVIVHNRDAHADTLEILKKHKPKGVVHCFSGSAEMAKEIIKLGMYIGIGGVITFKNAKKLCEVAKLLPMEKILLETDAPYMAPEPHRGKNCHSGFIAYTAQKIAELKGLERQEVIDIAANNVRELFNLK